MVAAPRKPRVRNLGENMDWSDLDTKRCGAGRIRWVIAVRRDCECRIRAGSGSIGSTAQRIRIRFSVFVMSDMQPPSAGRPSNSCTRGSDLPDWLESPYMGSLETRASRGRQNVPHGEDVSSPWNVDVEFRAFIFLREHLNCSTDRLDPALCDIHPHPPARVFGGLLLGG
jgi:hypothetical protein